MATMAAPQRLRTGVNGLDEILHGGILAGRAYHLRGGPGTGKTVLGHHFLNAGVENDEKSMFITLGEPEDQIRNDAAGMGFDLKNVSIVDLSPTSEFFVEVQQYDIFSPAEVERDPITQKIIDQIEKVKPARVFLDAMTQFRYLAVDDFQFRKQALSFLRYLSERGATVLFTSEGSALAPDDDLQFMSDGIIHLNAQASSRSISVSKFRGSGFQSGWHSMQLSPDGMKVWPRLRPRIHKRDFTRSTVSSGVPELDEILHGGLERGTVTIISGPTGVGKTTVGLQFMKEAAGRGERSLVCTFEEGAETLLHRAEGVKIPARTMQERGSLSTIQVEPLLVTPDEFAHMIREEVEQRDAQIVMIDSIAGYRLSLVHEEDLNARLHALCDYLRNMGVTVILVNEVEAITGDFKATEAGISYLADNILLMRYMERRSASGETHLLKSITVLKKRLTDFENTLRELQITRYGLKVGPPLESLEGLITGTPVQDRRNHSATESS